MPHQVNVHGGQADAKPELHAQHVVELGTANAKPELHAQHVVELGTANGLSPNATHEME